MSRFKKTYQRRLGQPLNLELREGPGGVPSVCLFSDMGYDVDGVMSELVNYERAASYLQDGVSDTVSETVEIAGKTVRTGE